MAFSALSLPVASCAFAAVAATAQQANIVNITRRFIGLGILISW
ncbi:hypothetical protein [Hydrocarboniphaga sp.]|nr:hypothetical protein [Hydrocarboniphaga sp.]